MYELDSCGSRPVAGRCGHGNGTSVSMTGEQCPAS